MTELKKKHMDAIVALTTMKGPKTKIAESLGITPQTLNNWIRDDLFHDELEKAYHEMMQCNLSAAITKVNELLYCNNPSVQLGAAKLILDRSGMFNKDKINIENSNGINIDVTISE